MFEISFGGPRPEGLYYPRRAGGGAALLVVVAIIIIGFAALTLAAGASSSARRAGPASWPAAPSAVPSAARPAARREKYGPPPGMARAVDWRELPLLYGPRGFATGPREYEGSSAGALGAYIERSA